MVAPSEGVVGVVSEAVAFRRALRSVEVGLLSGEAARLVAEEMARVEKASAALRAMAAARAADCGAHRGAGYADPDEWMARVTGESRARARSDLATGARLSDCPKTREAAAEGELSLGQADEITRTERDRPGSEDELVDAAKRSSRQDLADECRKRRQAGADREELAARQRARRSFRAWIDGDGMQSALLKLEPIAGVALLARIQTEADRLHREARKTGSTEPWEAHAADAVASILAAGLGWTPPPPQLPAAGSSSAAGPAPHDAAGSTKGADTGADSTAGAGSGGRATARPRAPRRADVVFVVDLRTFRRGMHPDFICHIVGGGPVPPAVVREMAEDAFLKGRVPRRRQHPHRHPPRPLPAAELRTALELGGPPDFDGVACSICGNRFRLQWDHIEPVCAGGVTSFANEDPKCWRCHDAKSRREREAGLYRRRRRAVGGDPDPPPDTG